MKGIIRYVLNDERKNYASSLPMITRQIDTIDSSIGYLETEIRKGREDLREKNEKLLFILRQREELIDILKKLKVIKKRKLKNLTEEDLRGISPSDIVPLDNPQIEIYETEEQLLMKEKEEKEKGE